MTLNLKWLQYLKDKIAGGRAGWLLALLAALGILLLSLPGLVNPPKRSNTVPVTAATTGLSGSGAAGSPSTTVATGGASLTAAGARASLSGSRSDFAAVAQYERDLAAMVEEALSRIAGAGRVKAVVSIEAGPELKLAQNETVNEHRTEEKDTTGGVRVITEISRVFQLVLGRQAGNEEPIVTRVIMPKVAGILVVAEGASNPSVRAELTRAVQALLNVPAYRVRVIPMKEGG
jgi:stage III sporulation protein AG